MMLLPFKRLLKFCLALTFIACLHYSVTHLELLPKSPKSSAKSAPFINSALSRINNIKTKKYLHKTSEIPHGNYDGNSGLDKSIAGVPSAAFSNQNNNVNNDIGITDVLTNVQNLSVITSSDIFFSIKSSSNFHETRLPLILNTWIAAVSKQVYIFTDSDPDSETAARLTADHIINTKCGKTHTRKSLCCKMAVEVDYFYSLKHKWFCHFDDDMYVNVPYLLSTLQRYSYTEDWYIGRPSLRHPMKVSNVKPRMETVSFWFATGGGFCISRPLMLKMMSYAAGGKLRSVCDTIRLPDDVTIGFIISHYLNTNLTVHKEFHTHLESLRQVNKEKIKQSITVSYGRANANAMYNRVEVPGLPTADDPTRFYSVHCLIHNISPCRIPT